MSDATHSNLLPLGLKSAGLVQQDLSPEEDNAIKHALETVYHFDSDRISRLSIEIFGLSFYETYRLLRFQERQKSNTEAENSGPAVKQAFALVQLQKAGDLRAILHPLTGKSDVIHQINQGHLRLGNIDEKSRGDSGARRRDYLCFFTWAVHATQGNFPIVEARDDLVSSIAGRYIRDGNSEERRSASDFVRETEESLEGIDFGIVRDEEVWRATVVYGRNLFRSEFTISDLGMIEMSDDTELLTLPQEANESFDRGSLFAIEEDRAPPICGLESESKELEEISAEGFRAKWRDATHDVRDLIVVDPVHLNTEEVQEKPIPQSKSIVSIRNCRFRNQVRLSSDRTSFRFRFRNCTFDQGIDLDGASIEGSIEFADCIFSKKEPENQLLCAPAIRLKNAEIKGDLNFRRCGISGRLLAPNLRIGGNLLLQGCRVDSEAEAVLAPTTLSNLEGWSGSAPTGSRNVSAQIPVVVLSQARIEGNLEITAASKAELAKFSDSFEELSSHAQPRSSNDWSNLNRSLNDRFATTFSGSCTLNGAEVKNRLLLFGFGCKGEFDLSHAKIGQISTSPNWHFHHQNLHHDRPIWPFCRMAGLKGPVEVHGNADLKSIWIKGNLALENSTFHKNLDLLSSQIDGNLELWLSEVKGWLSAIRFQDIVGNPEKKALEVRGRLNLTGSNLGYVSFRGIKVDGAFEMGTGHLKNLEIGFGWNRATNELKTKTKEPFIEPISSEIGSLCINSVDVDKSISLIGVSVRSATGDRPGIRITQNRIGGNLTFRPPVPLADYLKGDAPLDQYPWKKLAGDDEDGARTKALKDLYDLGSVDGSNSDQDGKIVELEKLRGFDFEREKNQPSSCDYPTQIEFGNLDLSGNQITGNVDLSNVHVESAGILLTHTEIGQNLIVSVQTSLKPDPIDCTRLCTRCFSFSLEKAVIRGDADLTGLRVLKGGNVEARDVEIRGDLLFVPANKRERDELEVLEEKVWGPIENVRPSQDEEPRTNVRKKETPPPRWFAQIEGELDLTAVQVGRLIMSGRNVPDEERHIRIPRGQIGRLEVLEPTPGPLDLTKTEVARWSVDDNDLPSAIQFAKVFRKLQPFDRATWLAVETRFRNEMQTKQANQLYRAMRKATRLEKRRTQDGFWKSLFREPIWWMKDFTFGLIGWGTNPWVAFWLWVFPFIAFALLLSNPKNVEAGPNLLQHPEVIHYLDSIEPNESEISITTISPETISGVSWGHFDGLMLACRYGIPVANLFSHDDWKASSKPAQALYSHCTFSPEQYGSILAAFSWFTWPLFLIFLARASVRDRQS